MADLKPNPVYDKIAVNDIPPASTLIFYGGTKITEDAGNYIYGFPYKPAPYHAAFYCERGLFVNVSLFTTIEVLSNKFLSGRRIDVITYPYMNEEQRWEAITYQYRRAGSKSNRWRLYDIKGFLYAGLKLIPGLKKLIKPSKRNDFCSDNVVDAFAKGGTKVSAKSDEETYPWDLVTYAWEHPEECKIYTLWVGPNYK